LHILGVSAYYHDSAACLVRDGRVVAAAQEERFTRRKHDHRFPSNAAEFCLRHAGITPAGLDYVAFYDKPLLKFERLLETYIDYAPRGLRSFLMAMPLWLKEKLWIRETLAKELAGAEVKGPEFQGKILFAEHHESHAASAFFPSPFERAAVLTMDGVGEWATSSYGHGRGNELHLLGELRFPHSLGLLYSAFTYYTGFRVNSGEYKVMGLAPYGEPKYVRLILDELVDLREDGSLRLNMKYFDFAAGLTMTNAKFDELFGGPPRAPEGEITQRVMDLARSVQEVTEEAMLRMARHAHRETGEKNLCLAGGVALNCVGNGRILREGPFENVWVQPAAGDAGGSLGAALSVWHQYLGNARDAREVCRGSSDGMSGAYLGPDFSNEEVEEFLVAAGARRVGGDGGADAGGREGGRVVPGTDGVRAAGFRQPQHPRRPALAADAVADEPQDQVPRKFPPLRPVGPARARLRLLRAGPRLSLHASGRAGARGIAARDDRRRGKTVRRREVERAALFDPGGDAR
jgi:carbamoyltransferase